MLANEQCVRQFVDLTNFNATFTIADNSNPDDLPRACEGEAREIFNVLEDIPGCFQKGFTNQVLVSFSTIDELVDAYCDDRSITFTNKCGEGQCTNLDNCPCDDIPDTPFNSFCSSNGIEVKNNGTCARFDEVSGNLSVDIIQLCTSDEGGVTGNVDCTDCTEFAAILTCIATNVGLTVDDYNNPDFKVCFDENIYSLADYCDLANNGNLTTCNSSFNCVDERTCCENSTFTGQDPEPVCLALTFEFISDPEEIRVRGCLGDDLTPASCFDDDHNSVDCTEVYCYNMKRRAEHHFDVCSSDYSQVLTQYELLQLQLNDPNYVFFTCDSDCIETDCQILKCEASIPDINYICAEDDSGTYSLVTHDEYCGLFVENFRFEAVYCSPQVFDNLNEDCENNHNCCIAGCMKDEAFTLPVCATNNNSQVYLNDPKNYCDYECNLNNEAVTTVNLDEENCCKGNCTQGNLICQGGSLVNEQVLCELNCSNSDISNILVCNGDCIQADCDAFNCQQTFSESYSKCYIDQNQDVQIGDLDTFCQVLALNGLDESSIVNCAKESCITLEDCEYSFCVNNSIANEGCILDNGVITLYDEDTALCEALIDDPNLNLLQCGNDDCDLTQCKILKCKNENNNYLESCDPSKSDPVNLDEACAIEVVTPGYIEGLNGCLDNNIQIDCIECIPDCEIYYEEYTFPHVCLTGDITNDLFFFSIEEFCNNASQSDWLVVDIYSNKTNCGDDILGCSGKNDCCNFNCNTDNKTNQCDVNYDLYTAAQQCNDICIVETPTLNGCGKPDCTQADCNETNCNTSVNHTGDICSKNPLGALSFAYYDNLGEFCDANKLNKPDDYNDLLNELLVQCTNCTENSCCLQECINSADVFITCRGETEVDVNTFCTEKCNDPNFEEPNDVHKCFDENGDQENCDCSVGGCINFIENNLYGSNVTEDLDSFCRKIPTDQNGVSYIFYNSILDYCEDDTRSNNIDLNNPDNNTDANDDIFYCSANQPFVLCNSSEKCCTEICRFDTDNTSFVGFCENLTFIWFNDEEAYCNQFCDNGSSFDVFEDQNNNPVDELGCCERKCVEDDIGKEVCVDDTDGLGTFYLNNINQRCHQKCCNDLGINEQICDDELTYVTCPAEDGCVEADCEEKQCNYDYEQFWNQQGEQKVCDNNGNYQSISTFCSNKRADEDYEEILCDSTTCPSAPACDEAYCNQELFKESGFPATCNGEGDDYTAVTGKADYCKDRYNPDNGSISFYNCDVCTVAECRFNRCLSSDYLAQCSDPDPIANPAVPSEKVDKVSYCEEVRDDENFTGFQVCRDINNDIVACTDDDCLMITCNSFIGNQYGQDKVCYRNQNDVNFEGTSTYCDFAQEDYDTSYILCEVQDIVITTRRLVPAEEFCSDFENCCKQFCFNDQVDPYSFTCSVNHELWPTLDDFCTAKCLDGLEVNGNTYVFEPKLCNEINEDDRFCNETECKEGECLGDNSIFDRCKSETNGFEFITKEEFCALTDKSGTYIECNGDCNEFSDCAARRCKTDFSNYPDYFCFKEDIDYGLFIADKETFCDTSTINSQDLEDFSSLIKLNDLLTCNDCNEEQGCCEKRCFEDNKSTIGEDGGCVVDGDNLEHKTLEEFCEAECDDAINDFTFANVDCIDGDCNETQCSLQDCVNDFNEFTNICTDDYAFLNVLAYCRNFIQPNSPEIIECPDENNNNGECENSNACCVANCEDKDIAEAVCLDEVFEWIEEDVYCSNFCPSRSLNTADLNENECCKAKCETINDFEYGSHCDLRDLDNPSLIEPDDLCLMFCDGLPDEVESCETNDGDCSQYRCDVKACEAKSDHNKSHICGNNWQLYTRNEYCELISDNSVEENEPTGQTICDDVCTNLSECCNANCSQVNAVENGNSFEETCRKANDSEPFKAITSVDELCTFTCTTNDPITYIPCQNGNANCDLVYCRERRCESRAWIDICKNPASDLDLDDYLINQTEHCENLINENDDNYTNVVICSNQTEQINCTGEDCLVFRCLNRLDRFKDDGLICNIDSPNYYDLQTFCESVEDIPHDRIDNIVECFEEGTNNRIDCNDDNSDLCCIEKCLVDEAGFEGTCSTDGDIITKLYEFCSYQCNTPNEIAQCSGENCTLYQCCHNRCLDLDHNPKVCDESYSFLDENTYCHIACDEVDVMAELPSYDDGIQCSTFSGSIIQCSDEQCKIEKCAKQASDTNVIFATKICLTDAIGDNSDMFFFNNVKDLCSELDKNIDGEFDFPNETVCKDDNENSVECDDEDECQAQRCEDSNPFDICFSNYTLKSHEEYCEAIHGSNIDESDFTPCSDENNDQRDCVENDCARNRCIAELTDINTHTGLHIQSLCLDEDYENKVFFQPPVEFCDHRIARGDPANDVLTEAMLISCLDENLDPIDCPTSRDCKYFDCLGDEYKAKCLGFDLLSREEYCMKLYREDNNLGMNDFDACFDDNGNEIDCTSCTDLTCLEVVQQNYSEPSLCLIEPIIFNDNPTHFFSSIADYCTAIGVNNNYENYQGNHLLCSDGDVCDDCVGCPNENQCDYQLCLNEDYVSKCDFNTNDVMTKENYCQSILNELENFEACVNDQNIEIPCTKSLCCANIVEDEEICGIDGHFYSRQDFCDMNIEGVACDECDTKKCCELNCNNIQRTYPLCTDHGVYEDNASFCDGHCGENIKGNDTCETTDNCTVDCCQYNCPDVLEIVIVLVNGVPTAFENICQARCIDEAFVAVEICHDLVSFDQSQICIDKYLDRCDVRCADRSTEVGVCSFFDDGAFYTEQEFCELTDCVDGTQSIDSFSLSVDCDLNNLCAPSTCEALICQTSCPNVDEFACYSDDNIYQNECKAHCVDGQLVSIAQCVSAGDVSCLEECAETNCNNNCEIEGKVCRDDGVIGDYCPISCDPNVSIVYECPEDISGNDRPLNCEWACKIFTSGFTPITS